MNNCSRYDRDTPLRTLTSANRTGRSVPPAVIARQWALGRLRKQVTDLERQLAGQQQRNRELDDDKPITVPGGEIGTRTASVRADPGAAKSGAIPISFSVEDVADAAVAVTEQSKFWMP